MVKSLRNKEMVSNEGQMSTIKYLQSKGIELPNLDYKESAKCDTFKYFLNSITSGDKNKFSLIQEVIGTCLTNSFSPSKGFVLLGDGPTGKTTLCNVIGHMVGEDKLGTRAANELTGPFFSYYLHKKLVNVSNGFEVRGKELNSEWFKALINGDDFFIERPLQEPIVEPLNTTIIITTNCIQPPVKLPRNLVIIPFEKTYSHNPADGQGLMDASLESKLLKEMDGIYNFALEGLKRLIENDFMFTNA